MRARVKYKNRCIGVLCCAFATSFIFSAATISQSLRCSVSADANKYFLAPRYKKVREQIDLYTKQRAANIMHGFLQSSLPQCVPQMFTNEFFEYFSRMLREKFEFMELEIEDIEAELYLLSLQIAAPLNADLITEKQARKKGIDTECLIDESKPTIVVYGDFNTETVFYFARMHAYAGADYNVVLVPYHIYGMSRKTYWPLTKTGMQTGAFVLARQGMNSYLIPLERPFSVHYCALHPPLQSLETGLCAGNAQLRKLGVLSDKMRAYRILRDAGMEDAIPQTYMNKTPVTVQTLLQALGEQEPETGHGLSAFIDACLQGNGLVIKPSNGSMSKGVIIVRRGMDGTYSFSCITKDNELYFKSDIGRDDIKRVLSTLLKNDSIYRWSKAPSLVVQQLIVPPKIQLSSDTQIKMGLKTADNFKLRVLTSGTDGGFQVYGKTARIVGSDSIPVGPGSDMRALHWDDFSKQLAAAYDMDEVSRKQLNDQIDQTCKNAVNAIEAYVKSLGNGYDGYQEVYGFDIMLERTQSGKFKVIIIEINTGLVGGLPDLKKEELDGLFSKVTRKARSYFEETRVLMLGQSV